MVKSVHPLLRHRLHALNGTDVVGFPVVVPGVDFDEVDLSAVGDEVLPTFGEEPVVPAPDEVLRVVMLDRGISKSCDSMI